MFMHYTDGTQLVVSKTLTTLNTTVSVTISSLLFIRVFCYREREGCPGAQVA